MARKVQMADLEFRRPRRRNTSLDEAEHAVAHEADQLATGVQGEMEQLQQSVGNRAVTRLVRNGAVQRTKAGQPLRARDVIQRQVQRDAKQPAAAKPMNEAQARAELTTHWGVGRIGAGTAADQEQHMLTLHSAYFKGVTPPANLGTLLSNAGWSAWQPPGGSSVWGDLVKAFEGLGKAFGGIPPVKEVLFFKTDYAYQASGPGGPMLLPNNRELASYSAGSYVIYEAATYQGTLMPMAQGKSVAGSAAPVGSTPQAHTLTHELGHGVVEAMLNNLNPDMLRDYMAAVGWFGGRLYDMGEKTVRDAIAGKTTPDAKYEITDANWSSSQWGEQPISKYSLAGPQEDFPEAVAAYVRDPATLKARSSRRYDFIAQVAATMMQKGAGSPLRQRT